MAKEAARAVQGLARRLAARKWYSSDQLLFDVPANAGAGRWVGATAGTAKWLVEICVEPGFSGFFWVELIGGIALCV